MAERHVRAGHTLVERQRRLTEELDADHPGEHIAIEAHAVLDQLEETQRLHEAHLAKLLGES